MTVKLRRIDVCDLLLACSCADRNVDDGSEKWKKLHDVLMEQLEAFDAKAVTE
jgi:hypothetical protein